MNTDTDLHKIHYNEIYFQGWPYVKEKTSLQLICFSSHASESFGGREIFKQMISCISGFKFYVKSSFILLKRNLKSFVKEYFEIIIIAISTSWHLAFSLKVHYGENQPGHGGS